MHDGFLLYITCLHKVKRGRKFALHHVEGCEVVHSVEEVFELCKNEEEIFIFGGAQIYDSFKCMMDFCYI
jgi:dihydrofolate reductase